MPGPEPNFVPLAGHDFVQAVREGCQLRQLAPLAVFANALHEGIDGQVGEQGHAYGPWQLDAGNGLPDIWVQLGAYSQDAQDFAWSFTGINLALSIMADGGARGLVHERATAAIAIILEGSQIGSEDLASRITTYRNLRNRGTGVWPYLAGLAGGPSKAAAPAPVGTPQAAIPTPHKANAAWQRLLHIYARTAPRRCQAVIRIANRLPRELGNRGPSNAFLASTSGDGAGSVVTLDDAEEFAE